MKTPKYQNNYREFYVGNILKLMDLLCLKHCESENWFTISNGMFFQWDSKSDSSTKKHTLNKSFLLFTDICPLAAISGKSVIPEP